jgi:predicted TIM-barrel fold metal-dependent hydrolase
MADGSIRALVDRGSPIADVLIIDGLVSVGPGDTYASYFPFSTTEGELDTMDRLGIDKACIISWDNEPTLRAMAHHPDRFIGFCFVNPNYPDEVVPELERCFDAGMKGIKLHPAAHTHYYPIDGPNYRPVFEFAAARRCPILIHSGPRTESDLRMNRPSLIAKVAESYPDAHFIISHCGAYDPKEPWVALDEAVEAARVHDNVYLNFNTLARYFGVIEYLVERVGADKVIFGSDAPQHCFIVEVGHVAYAKVSDDDKQKILGLNMQRLLRLDDMSLGGRA